MADFLTMIAALAWLALAVWFCFGLMKWNKRLGEIADEFSEMLKEDNHG